MSRAAHIASLTPEQKVLHDQTGYGTRVSSEVLIPLRKRLVAAIAAETTIPCPHCAGTGKVSTRRPQFSHAYIGAVAGVHQTHISHFVSGDYGLSKPAVDKLTAWLDKVEP